MILVFWGTSAQGEDSLVSRWVGKYFGEYFEEKAVAFDTNHPSTYQVADITSVFLGAGTAGGDSSSRSASPTMESTAIGESAFVALGPPDEDYLEGFKANQVVEYIVQPGDVIGLIAANFGVSVNTIVWANNIRNPDALSLGQTLKIPPVTGVIHAVTSGDTVASIAKKYKADAGKILSFNNLTNDQVLQVGDELMVPEGELPGPRIAVKSVAKSVVLGSQIYVPTKDGQCVSFVQAHGFPAPTYHGNANTWKQYINTPVPVVGGVVVLRGGFYGHVAIITAVKANSVQIVEQNYYGPHIVDHREISLSEKSIVGFIQ